MNKPAILTLSLCLAICLSCKKENPQTQIEQLAVDFCEAFYNFNYPAAQEKCTPSSLSYLSFLASNIRPAHLNQIKKEGAAKASILSSDIDLDSGKGTVICQIDNAHILHPVAGKIESVASLKDTLQVIKEDDKWLVRKDIPQQNGKQNHD